VHVYARNKHINFRFHKIRVLVAIGELLLGNIHTSKNAADILTKPVTIDKSPGVREERRRHPQPTNF